HGRDDAQAAQRVQEPQGEEQTAARLSEASAQRPESGGPEAHPGQTAGKAFASRAAEPAEELLRAVTDQEQTDHDPQHQQRYVHIDDYLLVSLLFISRLAGAAIPWRAETVG